MKYALLFGVNYTHTPEAGLRGCVNDVNNMKSYLNDKLHFDKIKVYTDEHNIYDTGFQNIIHKIYKLALKTNIEDIQLVYLHFSGHGTSISDFNGDDADGKDEAFVPSDYKRRGVIPDDLFKRVFKIFNPNTKIVCVFDCCHSGTALDLTYKYDHQRNVCIKNNKKDNIQCKAILLSACLDKQVAADVSGLLQTFTYNGAFTSSLITAFRKNSKLNIDSILLITFC